MNTEQSYVGRGTYASPQPKNGQIRPKTPNCSQDRFNPASPELCQKQAADDLIQLVGALCETPSVVPILTDVMTCWLSIQYVTPQDETTRRNLLRLLDLIAFLTEAKETYAQYEFFTNLIQQEVSHE